MPSRTGSAFIPWHCKATKYTAVDELEFQRQSSSRHEGVSRYSRHQTCSFDLPSPEEADSDFPETWSTFWILHIAPALGVNGHPKKASESLTLNSAMRGGMRVEIPLLHCTFSEEATSALPRQTDNSPLLTRLFRSSCGRGLHFS